MIRAAAKNHADVTVIVDPADYSELLNQLSGGEVSADFRKRMAWKAYQHTASYDAQVWMVQAPQLASISPYAPPCTWLAASTEHSCLATSVALCNH